MPLEPAITALLAYHEPLAALGGRVHPLEAPPESELPYAVYRLTGVERGPRTSGGLSAHRLTVDFVAATYAEAAQLADGAATLDGYAGHVAGCNIRGIFVEDAADDHAAAQAGRDDTIPWKAVDFRVWVKSG